jgi:hypothetical protein
LIEATALRDQIAVFRARMATLAPPEVIAAIDAELEKLAASQIARRALAVGAVAPDFTLPDVHGASVTLANMLARGPAIVTFYRGGWCPFCDLQLRSYQSVLADIHACGAELIAISRKPRTIRCPTSRRSSSRSRC